MKLEILTDKCLAKDAGKRYQSISNVVVNLGHLQEKLKSGESTILHTAAQPQPVAVEERAPAGWLRLYQALFVATAIAPLALAAVRFQETTAETPLRRFSFELPAPQAPPLGNYIYVAIPPVALDRVYRRRRRLVPSDRGRG